MLFTLNNTKQIVWPLPNQVVPYNWTNEVWPTVDTKLLEECFWGAKMNAKKAVMDLQLPPIICVLNANYVSALE